MSFSQGDNTDLNVEQITSDEVQPPTAYDLLNDLQDPEGLFNAQAIEVEVDERSAFGRSWQFDFVAGDFTPSSGGPQATRGLATLRNWIEKCLRTEGGGRFPVYSSQYGMVGVDSMIGLSQAAVDAGDLGDRIYDALMFHPRITDIVGFNAFIDPNDETLFVTFRVITDTDDSIQFTNFRVF